MPMKLTNIETQTAKLSKYSRISRHPKMTKKGETDRLAEQRQVRWYCEPQQKTWMANSFNSRSNDQASKVRLRNRAEEGRQRQALTISNFKQSSGAKRLMSTGLNADVRMSERDKIDRSDIRVAWNKVFGVAPPHHLSMIFMRKAIIYEEQCRCFGDLSQVLKRALKAAADGNPVNSSNVIAHNPGTQLIREWSGKVFEVEVQKDGYLLKDRKFKSLSAVALLITGTSWSGPRFFGLTRPIETSQ